MPASSRVDDRLIGVALLVTFVTCVVFRYLPMVDVPQHYAMVSILRHHGDPAYGFAQRYTFDFLGRPYATVYWLATALSYVMPLTAAMRIVIGLCTIAPFAGMWALLAATERPRAPLLLVMPFAFGSLWHWGFLNFLLGTGLFLGGLSLVVRVARDHRGSIGLFALAILLFFTHFHGLVMLCALTPVFAFAFGGRRSVVRASLPIVPAGILAVIFVAVTWRQASGSWAQMSPSLGERVSRFPEFLGAGLRDPWPDVLAAILGLSLLSAAFLAKKPNVAWLVALGLQVLLYFTLPLNTNTATPLKSDASRLNAAMCAIDRPSPRTETAAKTADGSSGRSGTTNSAMSSA
jgi:hypothetical protein